ncbi:MAG: DUF4942 domain-containing protein [Selenomonadaceae bacterium]|nr:DUF4942 domain-containing protein [Selenomonadaceae bacterium]MBP3723798.1 DUF4942 domain-containing protein [Selenomonadaceae bacterium]
MVDFEQYYPTPPETAEKLLDMVDIEEISNGINILEPSAGTGELIEAWKEAKHRREYCSTDYHGHCIEINPKRAATLKGKGYKVVWDDFLTFNPLMKYTFIMMNPPFREGARHLLKALEICAAGGHIACILNAETIKNPHTNEQKALIAKLDEQEFCEIEYVTAAFAEAERKTDVEVALIHIRKKAAPEICVTFENFKKQIFDRRKQGEKQNGALTRYGEVNALIDRYQAEVKAGQALYDEILNYKKVCLQGTTDQYDYEAVFKIEINGVYDDSRNDDRINIVRKINYKYWKILLYSKELSSLMTSDIQYKYSQNLTQMADYEFNERNILAMKEDLAKNLIHNIEVAIMDVWEEFTSRYTWSEYSKNIHYYNGWKTNKAFKINKKVIIPLNAFDACGDFRPNHRVDGKLRDIEKVMNYLDCGRTEDFEMYRHLSVAQSLGQNRGINTKYFSVDLFKKGTCHLTFKDMDLLKKFNLYCGRKKNWLPDDYGRKPYNKLDDEEREIVDSFEGKESYEDTYKNQEFYLPQNSGLLMLTMGNVKEAGGDE